MTNTDPLIAENTCRLLLTAAKIAREIAGQQGLMRHPGAKAFFEASPRRKFTGLEIDEQQILHNPLDQYLCHVAANEPEQAAEYAERTVRHLVSEIGGMLNTGPHNPEIAMKLKHAWLLHEYTLKHHTASGDAP